MGKSRYRYLFWDNDGVLVETEQLYFEANRVALAGYGIELTHELFSSISLIQGGSVLDLASSLLSIDQHRQLRSTRDRLYARLLNRPDLVKPGVRETLQQLQGRIGMAIVTSSRREHFHRIHAGSGLLPLFDFVLTREDYPLSKPHPDPYHAALQHAGITPAEGLVIEDTPRGLQAACRAGLDCLVLPNPLLAASTYPGALAVLNCIEEIHDFLRG